MRVCFRFDIKGQDYEAICKATCEQARAVANTRGHVRQRGRPLHQAGPIPDHRGAGTAHSKGACMHAHNRVVCLVCIPAHLVRVMILFN